MKAVMVMYDSLTRNYLSPYDCDWVHTPNFDRLAERACRFDSFYAGSLQCMPARRELHTGRYNFLHRSWGPLEPWDDSMPEILKKNGVYTHMVTDHYHYFEDGGCTYHNRFNSYEFSRGQEADIWKGEVAAPDDSHYHKGLDSRKGSPLLRSYLVNQKYITRDEEMPQTKTFNGGLEFIHTNHDQDNWFLAIETFDPHEPFHVLDEYKELYPHEYRGMLYDWPAYKTVDEDEETVNHVRMIYAALVSMCDAKLGQVLDAFDKYNLWEDTMLIVNTDHGFLVGEHEWWGKWGPLYNNVANTPFFLYDPRFEVPRTCDALCQTIDIAPSLLEFFGVDIPKDMMGKPLRTVYHDGGKIRDYALYGVRRFYTNCITDGRYTYFRTALQREFHYEYTLMPTNMRAAFPIKELKNIEIVDGFTFTKGAKVMKIKRYSDGVDRCAPCDMLFDLESDPGQLHNLYDWEKRAELCNRIRDLMLENDAPEEDYERFGLSMDRDVTAEMLKAEEEERTAFYNDPFYVKYPFTVGAKEFLHTVLEIVFSGERDTLRDQLTIYLNGMIGEKDCIRVNDLSPFFEQMRETRKSRVERLDVIRGFYYVMEQQA